MTATGFTFFDTAIGRCAIAWNERGVCGVQLPDSSEGRMRARAARRYADAVECTPPPEVRDAIDRIVRLLQGELVDLTSVVLDMEWVDDFERRVYVIARTIPAGRTLTYGEVARRLGAPGAARAVGRALGRNPFAIVVPCHRVVAAGGNLGGFSATGGVATKRRMLAIEGAPVDRPFWLTNSPP